MAVIAGGAVLTKNFVRRRFPQLAEDAHNDATRFAYGVIGFVYAFFVRFMVSALWSQINTEDGQARNEGAPALQLVRDLTVFEPPDRDRMWRALLDYKRAALTGWPITARGGQYPEPMLPCSISTSSTSMYNRATMPKRLSSLHLSATCKAELGA
ncbi:hypothetical protein MB901379_03947 [Mycobacterium basiliense]|uniref:Uncharacterized protein n=1 Tax=Mycobacterium basiliense TaxID=2094119 RepID=A0A3S4FTF2_9MYCO|nr:hypothetical protein [Mycobacterium basiliense]VDM90349.1 hypothetical protein MB901379_03947 [Mycobacterium basiliense]